MSSRRVHAIAAVALLFLLGGCLGPLGGGSISDEDLDAEAEYNWDTTDDVHVEVNVGEFHAVYHLDGDRTFELSQSTYYRDRPLDIEAVRYRYPNGTERTGSDLDIEQSRSTTHIEVPDGNGTLAFTGPAGSKQVVIPGLVEGSYTVELPRGHRVGNFFLSNVGPSHAEEEVIDDRHVLQWNDNSDDINIRFYLWRDHYLFYGIMGGLGLFALGGVVYYRRKIRRLAQQRRDIGLNVYDDEDE